jgi:SAM-dependent methyltransferase
MNPQPLSREVQLRYLEGHGAEYLAYETAHEAAFLHLQELALGDAGFYDPEKALLSGTMSGTMSGTRPGEAPRVLDIGCATGALLARLRDRGWQTMGIEISPAQAEYASQNRGLDVRTLPLEENHFPPERFRAVLASHLIEHLNDPASLVREAYRVLEKKGSFFVTTPNIAGFQARLLGPRWRSAIFDHLYLFSVKTLGELLRRAGFRVEKIATWGGFAAGLVSPGIKAWADRGAKKFGLGDVMIIRGVKD